MTIEEKIELIGGKFRGLWRSIILWNNPRRFANKWTVTFQYQNEFVETDGQDTPHEALDEAIKLLGLT